jgi:hypothetical protein
MAVWGSADTYGLFSHETADIVFVSVSISATYKDNLTQLERHRLCKGDSR